MFPRQFPLWRPPAQWSRTVGAVAHSGQQLQLFREGHLASPGLALLAQTGETLALEAEIQNSTSESLRSVFSVLPVPRGEGQGQTNFFLPGGENTRVSCVTGLIPSPDWFVGVDNLQLCEAGQFLSHLAVDLQLFDAGTDNGLTFTAPNWETSPPAPVTRITNLSPSHPAASFYYPELKSLPTIARYVFSKVQEFGPGGPDCPAPAPAPAPVPAPAVPTAEAENFVTIETFDVTVKHPLDRKEFKYEIVKERPQVVRNNETRADKRTGHLKGCPDV